ncbi:MAG: DUF6311 domain-containing protein [Gallionella sp.]|nr:DUF6311 domain-containing protein [Gallionella sp.]
MQTNNTWRSQTKQTGAWGGLLLGILFFLWLYGAAILNPAETGWMLHGDPAQHYLGWEFFRREPWSLPLGRIENFGAPLTASIVFTDSLPLLAIPLKLLSPWLPETFQYFGAWMLLCHALTGWFAWRIFSRLGLGVAASALGTLLMLLMPAMMLRAYGHESLMAHWLILAAIDRYLAGWSGRGWLALVLLAAAVHAYLLAMLLAIFCAAWLRAVAVDRTLSLVQGGARAALGALLLGGWMALLGYFVGATKQLAAEGYGHYSANLLTWFDPMDWRAFLLHYGRDPAGKGEWSHFLPALGQTTAGQYEGFAYLGAGLLLLAGIALVSVLRRRQRLPGFMLPLLAVALALFIAALSNRVSLGGRELFAVPLSDTMLGMLSIFRASGRFVWPLTYLAAIAAVVVVARQWPARAAVPLLALAVLVQTLDMNGKLREFRDKFHRPAAYQNPLADPLWESAAQRHRRIVVYPAEVTGGDWIPFARLAALSGASINVSNVARADEQGRLEAAAALEAEIASGALRPDTLYVLRDAGIAREFHVKGPARMRQMDGYTVFFLEGI